MTRVAVVTLAAAAAAATLCGGHAQPAGSANHVLICAAGGSRETAPCLTFSSSAKGAFPVNLTIPVRHSHVFEWRVDRVVADAILLREADDQGAQICKVAAAPKDGGDWLELRSGSCADPNALLRLGSAEESLAGEFTLRSGGFCLRLDSEKAGELMPPCEKAGGAQLLKLYNADLSPVSLTTAPPSTPSASPTASPTAVPSLGPSGSPTAAPTLAPAGSPTAAPTRPTMPPSAAPIRGADGLAAASQTPTAAPSSQAPGGLGLGLGLAAAAVLALLLGAAGSALVAGQRRRMEAETGKQRLDSMDHDVLGRSATERNARPSNSGAGVATEQELVHM